MQCTRPLFLIGGLVCETMSLPILLPSADVTVSVPAMLSVGEGDGMVQVCATLSAVEETERNFTITLTNSDDTGYGLVFK